jgi:curved DNA-binding protein CbpA
MARVNDAWRVLSDPDARRAYDASLRTAAAQPVAAVDAVADGDGQGDDVAEDAEEVEAAWRRRRWPLPWSWTAVLAALVVIFVFTAYALGPGQGDGDVDGVLRSGSCVRLDLQSLAFEVRCDGPHYGVVERLAPFDARCPASTEGHPDQGGQGLVCVTPGVTAGG